MTNDPNDRHVLAAAVAAGSELIVTFNQPFAATSLRHTIAYSRDSHKAIRAARASSPARRKPAYARSRCTTAASASRNHQIARPSASSTSGDSSPPCNAASSAARAACQSARAKASKPSCAGVAALPVVTSPDRDMTWTESKLPREAPAQPPGLGRRRVVPPRPALVRSYDGSPRRPWLSLRNESTDQRLSSGGATAALRAMTLA